MKTRIFLFSDTVIKRKNNTLVFETCVNPDRDEDDTEELEFIKEDYLMGSDLVIPSGDRKYMPVEGIDSIFACGSVNFNSRLLYFLSQNSIPLHVFNFRGSYAGSFYPTNSVSSGSLLVKMSSFYKDQRERLFLAKQFVSSAAKNALGNMKYYNRRGSFMNDHVEHAEELSGEINTATSIDELMGIEGTIKKIYYDSWKNIFNKPTGFTRRIKNPPNNLINSLISYGNMIVYGVCVNELNKTRLNPEIGYLHETVDARLSLSLDLAEIFKPVINDTVIFKMINKNMIGDKDCRIRNNYCKLDKDARIKFAREIEDKLNSKIQLPGKAVKYSFTRVIREECYKLIKHFNNEKRYKAYINKV